MYWAFSLTCLSLTRDRTCNKPLHRKVVTKLVHNLVNYYPLPCSWNFLPNFVVCEVSKESSNKACGTSFLLLLCYIGMYQAGLKNNPLDWPSGSVNKCLFSASLVTWVWVLELMLMYKERTDSRPVSFGFTHGAMTQVSAHIYYTYTYAHTVKIRLEKSYSQNYSTFL